MAPRSLERPSGPPEVCICVPQTRKRATSAREGQMVALKATSFPAQLPVAFWVKSRTVAEGPGGIGLDSPRLTGRTTRRKTRP